MKIYTEFILRKGLCILHELVACAGTYSLIFGIEYTHSYRHFWRKSFFFFVWQFDLMRKMVDSLVAMNILTHSFPGTKLSLVAAVNLNLPSSLKNRPVCRFSDPKRKMCHFSSEILKSSSSNEFWICYLYSNL